MPADIKMLTDAVALILCVDAMPDDLNPETVRLCPTSRTQLELALQAGGEVGTEALMNVNATRLRYRKAGSKSDELHREG